MAQSGFTPIQLYRSTTAAAVPTAGNLVAGELAINLTDEKLYFENASGVVKVLADSTYVGTVTSVAASGGTTGMTFSGSPITGAGTLTLSGTLVAVNGGTGQSSYAIGDILFASTTTALSKLADVATGNALISGGVGVAPLYGKIGLTTHVSGTLPVANGGTGVTTSTGTGSVVLSDSPTLVTPTLGAASATSIANGLGAVGTPSYTFTGDLNTGLWSPGVDTIAFSTNGAERMRLDSSGNLGIGTASLAARFTVNGGAGTSQTRFEVSTTEVQEVATNAAQSAYANRLADAAQHIWKITGTERMRIDSSGNVGIGTSSPAYLLHLNQNGNTQAWVSATNVGSNSAGIGFENQGQRNWQIWADRTNDALQFGNNSRATTNMVITSAGNVGIGTSSPGAKLDVRSANIADGTNGGVINAYSTTAQAANIGGKIDLGGLYDGSNSLSFASVAGRKENSTSGDWSGYMQFSTRRFGADFVERMRIDSSGNVGIGTSSPTYRLDVASGDTTASVGYAMRIRSNATATAAAIQFTNSAASAQNGLIRCTDTGETVIQADGASSLVAFRTNGDERMRINSSGNVGIGTSAPVQKLQVHGSDGNDVYTRISNTDSGTSAGLLLGLNGNEEGIVRVETNQALIFGTNNTERMRITAAGNVGIGTTSPADLLNVSDGTANIQLKPVGGSSIGFVGLRSNHALGFTTNDTERMRIDSSGNVGIGTSAPSYTLQVNAASGGNQVAYFVNDSAGSTLAGIASSINGGGNNTNSFHFAGVTQTVALWYLYGNGTTSYTSDIRVKKNVTTTRDGYLEDVCKLRVVKYNWYNDSDDTPRELGFIAQEVEQVFPGLVQDALHPTKDGEIHKVLKGSVLMPIMLKALQEASAKIDALTARVAQLEGN